MGGFAVDIDWGHGVDRRAVGAMLALIPHRATAGTATLVLNHAALGEARTGTAPGQPTIVTDGRFALVGDLRLWSRDGLRSRAGGSRRTREMDDRRLLLAAYARTGIGFLDDVDGDFAFVIWDDERRRALAVRDRFATKPLYYEATHTGIRLATEAKQLIAPSPHPPRPNGTAVAEYLAGSYHQPYHTFFEGISKVPAAQYLLAEQAGSIERTYWEPAFEQTGLASQGDVADAFREHLISSVRRRIGSTRSAVAHLTGGLDSSSITSAAAIAAGRDGPQSSIQTVSAIFPGDEADESGWIREIASTQPFPHQDFAPASETVETYKTLMWEADSLVHNRISGIWSGTANIANAVGADLVLMGSGGDEVAGQEQLLADLLRHGDFREWRDGVAAEASWYGLPRYIIFERSLRRSLPPRTKQLLRKYLNRSTDTIADPLSAMPQPHTQRLPARSLTQGLLVQSTRDPLRILVNESQEAEYAHHGVSVTYPYLDRSLVEFVASIPPRARPFDGATKTLVRKGFSGHLPDSVLSRRRKSVADAYLAKVFLRLSNDYRDRYPTVPGTAADYVAEHRYAELLSKLNDSAADPSERDALWRAWTVMLWLENFEEYRLGQG